MDSLAPGREPFGTDDGEELREITERGERENSRRAGRRRMFSEEETAELFELQAEGIPIRDLARLYGVSRQVIGKYLNPPLAEGYVMRMTLMYRRLPCTTIDVNFLERKILIPLERLHRAFKSGSGLAAALASIPHVDERISYTVDFVESVTGLRDTGPWLTATMELDAFILTRTATPTTWP